MAPDLCIGPLLSGSDGRWHAVFARIDGVLAGLGLPPHAEPEFVGGDLPVGARLGGGLWLLRGLAAHLWLEGAPPTQAMDPDVAWALVDRYARQRGEEPARSGFDHLFALRLSTLFVPVELPRPVRLDPAEGEISTVASSLALEREGLLVANALGLFDERDPRYDWLYHVADGNPDWPGIRGRMPEALAWGPPYGQAAGAVLKILLTTERAHRAGASVYLI